jgi:2-oxo-4-hydroxy-4-carboxy-5-ureidoimidazoline decarboxylase
VTGLAVVNELDRKAFVALLGSSFEHADWVAEQAFDARPFATVTALHAAMMDTVRNAPQEARLAFLNGHPELASADARLAMTADSVSEQGSAGLDRLSAVEFDRFDDLNSAYRTKFGFPFIIAVRGRSKDEILSIFRERLATDVSTEMEAALTEIALITRMRLERLIKEPVT